ncbi:MAG TPA: amidohydrolase family protein [Gaiellaceae bacterium]|nr:amidohydrolase family protein [Gaiellaceae bacterium]
MTEPRESEDELFEAAYTAPVVDAAPPTTTRGARELLPRAAPAEAIAFRGCVLTPAEAIEDGYVVVAGKQIQAVQKAKPQGVRTHETSGVIVPGLIDLHGHPEFNVFAAWEPPRRFPNRYAWRGSDLYKELVRRPQDRLLKAVPPKTQLRYSEVRALVGGVTAMQGTGGQATSYQDEALVRNVDKWIFGGQVGRSMIDLPSGSRGMPELESILAGITAGTVKAFYIHLAEGARDNERSREEFDKLVELEALTNRTVVIHGSALTKDQLGDLKDAGAKLVWSPQSNLRLYAETTRAADALELGLPVGLGADWLPSGSTSLLAELKVARRELSDQGAQPKAKKLVDMVTRDAAAIAGLGDKLGTLAAGRPADVLVLERRREDPWENVVEADPAWVDLIMIDGDLAYGREDWLRALIASDKQEGLEPLRAWAKRMLLDTSYAAQPAGGEPVRLAELRAALIEHYPQVGPIFA